MSEACGDASTVHRLLQYGGEEGSFRSTRKTPGLRLLIVDEFP